MTTTDNAMVTDGLTRPIVGINNRTAQEAFDIMCDRIRPLLDHITAQTEEIERCPICAEPFKPDDTCASDIEMGACHAACLEGSPVVDLETGEETGGKVDTYPYSEVMEPPAPSSHLGGSGDAD